MGGGLALIAAIPAFGEWTVFIDFLAPAIEDLEIVYGNITRKVRSEIIIQSIAIRRKGSGEVYQWLVYGVDIEFHFFFAVCKIPSRHFKYLILADLWADRRALFACRPSIVLRSTYSNTRRFSFYDGVDLFG